MALAHVNRHRWKIPEYERLYEMGLVPRRVELMDGEIITMPPMETPHRTAITKGTNLLAELFGSTHWIQVQCPLNIPDYFQPEPDFLLLPRSFDLSAHPTTADLIIEVADSSLAYDRNEKASAYAMAGVLDYWIVNLVNSTMEVRREPGPDTGAVYGHSYRLIHILMPEDSASPLFNPQVSVPVTAFF